MNAIYHNSVYQADNHATPVRYSGIAVKNRAAWLHDICSTVTYIAVVAMALRGLVTMLAADPSNRLVRILAIFTDPLVQPFKPLFTYDTSVFEVYVAVAILVYAVIGWSIVQILTVVRNNSVEIYYNKEKI